MRIDIKPDSPFAPKIEMIDAEVRRLTVRMKVSCEALRAAEEPLTDMIAMDLVRAIAVIPGDRVLDLPASWYDHFLLTYLPPRCLDRLWYRHVRPWLVRRRGAIKYNTYRAEQFMTHIAVPPGRSYVTFNRVVR